ncbi:hypothetical protein C8R27_12215 [Nitrosomonas ureae]|uniref:hypothetical protein n=1 Tax=Nitrosomonas ureae TaxID=44577 RepID=UPI000D771D36|nr:hypothetical protein [Nitrosomonas ureae]PXX12821.1 hypothetical protein C8R27_12215 [Nitrosomonas ureae]
MLPEKTIFKFTAIISSLFFAACSSTSEVQKLAQITAANSSLVNTELISFAEKRREIAESRIKAIASLSKEAEQQQVTFEAYRLGAQAAAAIAGEKNNPNYATLLNELERTSKAVQEYQGSVQLKQASINQEILTSLQPLEIPKSNLSAISTKLGELAKESTYEEQMRFLTGFFSAVLNDIKTAQKASSSVTNNNANIDNESKK